MNALLLVIPFLAVAASVWWVYADARRQLDHGIQVVASLGGFTIDSPEAWAIGCVIVWIVVFPVYLVARRA